MYWVEKQHIPILQSLDWPNRSIALKTSTLTITPPMWALFMSSSLIFACIIYWTNDFFFLENLYHKKKQIFAYICKNTPQNLNDQKYFWWRGWELCELFSFTMGEGWVLNKIYIFSIIYSQILPPLVHDRSPSKIVLMEFDDIRMIHNDLQLPIRSLSLMLHQDYIILQFLYQWCIHKIQKHIRDNIK